MSDSGLAYVLDGLGTRLNPGAGRSLAEGPGHIGRGGIAGVAVWAASEGIKEQDLFAGFWRDEAGGIDWLSGYLCDPDMVVLFTLLAEPGEDEEEAEELYSRASMNTLESDPQAEYL